MAKKKAEKTPTTDEPANAVPGESNIATISGPRTGHQPFILSEDRCGETH
jgi:hypothetical protein